MLKSYKETDDEKPLSQKADNETRKLSIAKAKVMWEFEQ